MKKIDQKWILLILLSVIFLFRLTLLNQGYFHFQDELRYRYTWTFLKSLSDFNFRHAFEQLFQFKLYARPLLVIANIPTAIVQVFLLFLTGIKTESPTSLWIVKLFQVIYSAGISYFVYLFINKYSKSRLLGLAGLIVFSFLLNTNLYIRHIVPYDLVLLINLWMLWRVVNTKSVTYVNSVVYGALVAAAYLIYPTYYQFGLIIGLMLTFINKRGWLKRGLSFGFGGMTVLLLTELGSNLYNLSYLKDTQFLSTRVVLGSPEESFVFLWRYLSQVEGLIGIALGVLLIIGILHLLAKGKLYTRKYRLLVISSVVAYITHAIQGPLLGKVYYGRSIHMFYPLMVVIALMFIGRVRLRKSFAVGLVVISLVSLSSWYPQFQGLQYPRDLMFQVCGYSCNKITTYINENFEISSKNQVIKSNSVFLAINFTSPHPASDKVYPYQVPDNAQLILSAPHPINFAPYKFEWQSIEERQYLDQHKFQMNLYKLNYEK